MHLPKIVFSGFIGIAILSRAAIAADGYFDTTWAGSGRIVFAGDFHNPGYESGVRRVIIEPNGNLLLGGAITTQQKLYWWLGELRSGGTPMLTFGESNGSGVVTGCYLSADLCTGAKSLRAMELASDGHIAVAAGEVLSRTTQGAHALDGAGVVGGSGSVDLGLQLNNVQGRMTEGNAIASLSNGKWIVGGIGKYSAAAVNVDLAVVRLNPDFSLDTGFNAATDGNGVTFRGGQIVSLGADSYAVAVSVQGDGRIVLAAQIQGASATGALVRLNATGAIDSTFGSGGVSGLGSCVPWPNSHITVDRAGRLMLACNRNGSAGMRVIRLSGDGVSDSGFGTMGVATAVPAAAQCFISVATALAVDSAGRILVAGQCTPPSSGGGSGPPVQFLVARLHGDDGSLDTSFGIDGFAHGKFAEPSGGDIPWDIALDAGGRPIIAGDSHSGASGQSQAGVARLGYDLIYTDDFERVPRGRL